MPKLLVYAKVYAEEHFRTEVRKQQGVLDLMSMQALADAVGIPRQTLCKRMAAPESMTVAELRKLVDKAKLDPAVILELLGYTSKDIRKMREQPA